MQDFRTVFPVFKTVFLCTLNAILDNVKTSKNISQTIETAAFCSEINDPACGAEGGI